MLTVSGFYLLTGIARAWLAQLKLSILSQTLLMISIGKFHTIVLLFINRSCFFFCLEHAYVSGCEQVIYIVFCYMSHKKIILLLY